MSAVTILRWPDPRLAEVFALHELGQFDGLVTFDQVVPAKRATLEVDYAAVVA